MPRPTSQDLAGYWDMLQLSVEDVGMKFDELHQLKLNGWKIMESPERKVSVCALRRPPPPPSLAPPVPAASPTRSAADAPRAALPRLWVETQEQTSTDASAREHNWAGGGSSTMCSK